MTLTSPTYQTYRL